MVAAVVVGAVVLTARHFGTDERRRLAASCALAMGAGVFLIGTAYTRWYVTPTADSQSRYLYTTAALLLPAIAVCADAIIRRWRVAASFVLGLFVFATVVNIGKFGDRPPFDDDFQRAQRKLITSMAYSDAPLRFRRMCVRASGSRWAGYVPSPPTATSQSQSRHPRTSTVAFATCWRSRSSVRPTRAAETVNTREPGRPPFVRARVSGIHFANKPAVDTNYFVQDAILVTPIENGRAAAPLAFKSEFGRTFEVEVDDLTLRVQPADPTQRVILCGLERGQVERDQLNGKGRTPSVPGASANPEPGRTVRR